MKWYSFRKKKPRVGEMILICLSTGKEKSVVYSCRFEKFEHPFKFRYFETRQLFNLANVEILHFSNLVLFSGDYSCNHSNYVTLPLDPYNFHWARLY